MQRPRLREGEFAAAPGGPSARDQVLTPAAPPTGTRSKAPEADDIFSASSYAAWVRNTMRATECRGDTAVLYGSSISEPTDELIDQVREAFSDSVTSRYISVFSDGNRYVGRAICARYGLQPEQILTTTGVTSALSMIVKTLTGPGDRVIIEQPGFDLLTLIAREAGAEVDFIARTAPEFKFDLAGLAQKITERTKLAIVTNLHNPSGAYLLPHELAALARILSDVGAVLVVDEVYADFMRPVYSEPAATLMDNIISTNSLTKVFGLHALKCGWMVASPDVLGRIQSEASDGDTNISKLAHAVAAHVLESADIFDKRWRRILAATRPVMTRHIAAMSADGLIEGELPEFGCMYFPKIGGVTDTLGLTRKLWREHAIQVAPGEYFGLPGHIRIGFGGDPNELDQGLTRLHRALGQIARDR